MLNPGDRIGDWIVVELLGEGGMGAVYRCRNAMSERIEAAVKVVKPHSLADEMERFLREVESLDSLRHRSIVRVKGWGQDIESGSLWLAMEMAAGEDLEKRLRRGALPAAEVRKIFGLVADGLRHAHVHGIFHRDIKPANLVLLPGGDVRLVDFGIAMQTGRSRLTALGTFPGTPAYMAPEIFNEGQVQPRLMDIYALGQLICESLTGEPCFSEDVSQPSTGQRLVQLMGRKMESEPLDPGEGHPADLRDLVRRATDPDPRRRLQDMASFVEVLTGRPAQHTFMGTADVVAQAKREAVSDLSGSAPTVFPGDTFGFDPSEAKAPAEGTEWVHSAPSGPPPPVASGAPPAPVPQRQSPPPVSPPPVAAPPGSGVGRWIALSVAGMVGLGAVGVVLVLIAAAAGMGLSMMGGETSIARDVRIAVTGVAAETELRVNLGGRGPVGRDGLSFDFAQLPFGEHDLRVIAGPGCADERWTGGDCPGCCSCAASKISVVPGDDLKTELLQVDVPPPPDPRPVLLSAPKMADDWSVLFDLGGSDGPKGKAVDKRSKQYADVPPGTYSLRVEAGRCPTEDRGCWPDGTCPSGCRSFMADVTIPCGAGEYGLPIELPTPEGKPPTSSSSTAETCRTACPSGADTSGYLAAGTRVRIVGIHPDDAYCGWPGIVGREGKVVGEVHSTDGCWMGGGLSGDDGLDYYFYKAAFKTLSAAPPAPERYWGSAIHRDTMFAIVDVHPDDAYYGTRGTIIGKTCFADDTLSATDAGWYAGPVTCNDGSYYYFYKVAASM